MSHFSRIKTRFRNREALVACLQDMGFVVDPSTTTIRGFRGQQTVDLAARGKNGLEIGFLKNPDGSYDMIGDWWAKGGAKEHELARRLQEQAGRIQQEYARRMVLAQTKSEGFSVVEEHVQEDGSIRILVRRWIS